MLTSGAFRKVAPQVITLRSCRCSMTIFAMAAVGSFIDIIVRSMRNHLACIVVHIDQMTAAGLVLHDEHVCLGEQ